MLDFLNAWYLSDPLNPSNYSTFRAISKVPVPEVKFAFFEKELDLIVSKTLVNYGQISLDLNFSG